MNVGQTSLPFAAHAESPQARHASFSGAKDAEPRAESQRRRVLFLLADRGPLTDWQMKLALKLERSTINARRRLLCKGLDPCVEAQGFTDGPTGAKNTRWGLTDRGRALVARMRAEEQC